MLGSDPGVGAGNEINPSIERIDRRSRHCRLIPYRTEPMEDHFGAKVIGPRPSKRACDYPNRRFEVDSNICVHLESLPPADLVRRTR